MPGKGREEAEQKEEKVGAYAKSHGDQLQGVLPLDGVKGFRVSAAQVLRFRVPFAGSVCWGFKLF